jgi:hypothetical protein
MCLRWCTCLLSLTGCLLYSLALLLHATSSCRLKRALLLHGKCLHDKVGSAGGSNNCK